MESETQKAHAVRFHSHSLLAQDWAAAPGAGRLGGVALTPRALEAFGGSALYADCGGGDMIMSIWQS